MTRNVKPGRVAVIGAGPAGMAAALSLHQAALRDFVADHTPLLQKVIGESAPGEIINQIAEIDRAESVFQRVIANDQQP